MIRAGRIALLLLLAYWTLRLLTHPMQQEVVAGT